jgi:protein PhnA
MIDVRDTNGNVLTDGDLVQIIKDLKVKGTSVTLKRGSVAKNIRLTDDPEEVDCNVEKVKGLVLKTCFLKKF